MSPSRKALARSPVCKGPKPRPSKAPPAPEASEVAQRAAFVETVIQFLDRIDRFTREAERLSGEVPAKFLAQHLWRSLRVLAADLEDMADKVVSRSKSDPGHTA